MVIIECFNPIHYIDRSIYVNGGVFEMRNYVEAELEIIAFDAEDVITTSCPGEDDNI